MNLSLHHSDSAGKIITEAKIERDEFSVCNKMRTQFIKLEIKFVRARFEIAKSFPTGAWRITQSTACSPLNEAYRS